MARQPVPNWRGVGGSDGAGNDAGDLPGDPAQPLAWVQLPSAVCPEFSALTGCLKLILPLLPSPSKHLGSAGKQRICPSSVPRYQMPHQSSALRAQPLPPEPRGWRGPGGVVPNLQVTRPVPSPSHSLFSGGWSLTGSRVSLKAYSRRTTPER